MNIMLNEEGLTFKEIEEEIFRMVCEWGQSFAKDFLERTLKICEKNLEAGERRLLYGWEIV